MRVRSVFLGVAALGAVGLLGQWYFRPAQIEQYAVQSRSLAREITGPGLLGAMNQVIVTAKIQGFLSSIDVERNDLVKIGQVIARLDASEIAHEYEAAQATARAAAEAIREAEIEKERAELALRRATQDFNRKKLLIDRKSISQAEFDLAETAKLQADADISRASVVIERAKAEAATAIAKVAALKTRLDESTIASPINGIVISRGRNVGDLLMPGLDLVQVVDPLSVVVFARFDESTIDDVRTGDPAVVRFASDSQKTYPATVARVGRQVDEETREFTVDIKLNALPANWAIGQRANVTIRAETPRPAIAVPEKYIARVDGRAGVWTVRDGRASWSAVTLGHTMGGEMEVVEGLAVGDVVLDPKGRYSFQPIAALAAEQ
jgi:HlyD family secretion protein